jgi:TfoX/Sxy family transcriptional regulator of competence genes
MAWVKIPKENHPLFEAALPLDDRITVKAMFGGLCAMMHGMMMAGLFAESAFVRVSEADAQRLLDMGGAPFDPMGHGRTMAACVMLPAKEFHDVARLAGWLARSRDYVATLPPKTQGTAARTPSPAAKKPAAKKPAAKKPAAKKPAAKKPAAKKR